MPRTLNGKVLSSTMLKLIVIVCLLATFPPAKAQTDGKQKKNQAKPSSYQRVTDPAQYVGADTCKTCHEDMPSKGFFKSYEDSPHFVTTLDTKRGPEWHGCEACHGPGKEHVDGGGDKTKIFIFKDVSSKQTSAVCLRCHQYTEEHGNYNRSMHLANGVGCTDCHSPHHATENQSLMKAKSPDLCYTCHMNVRAEFARPFRHRVNEGLIQCNDCHSPHGTTRAKQLRSDAAGGE